MSRTTEAFSRVKIDAQKQELLAKLEVMQKEFKAAKKYAVKKKLGNEIALTMARLREIIENPHGPLGIG